MTESAPWRQFRHMADVVLLLVQRDFKGRFKHTKVGLLWSVISPLMFLLIFYLLFRLVLNFDIPKFATFVFTGILAWTWFQSSLVQGVNSITVSPSLVSQPGFPVAALPIIAVTSNFLTLLISFPLLILLLLLEGGSLSLAMLSLPGLFIVQYVMTLGIAYALAALNVAFRDIEHALPIVLQLGYYLTPIFYDVTQVPQRYRPLFEANPMFHIIDAYRAILIGSRLPDLLPIFLILIASCALLWFGMRHFERARYRFLEEL